MLRFRHGNLFDHRGHIGHCVSQDLSMHRGIAKEFKKRFGGISELREQTGQVGDVKWIHRDGRYILYIITKDRFFHKPTYPKIEEGLVNLRSFLEMKGIHSIGIPRICCGKDRKNWNDVRALIEKVFKGAKIWVIVYV